MSGTTIKKHLPELAFILGMFGVYLVWAAAIPFDGAPDEGMKWDLIRYIFNTGTYPAGFDPAIVSPFYGNSYAFEPALLYLAQAAAVKGWSLFSANASGYYMVARAFSAALSCGTIFFLFRISRRLFSAPTAWLFAAGIALLPQYAFLSGYINNDIFGIFCGSLLVYSWLRGMDSGWEYKDCLRLGCAMGLCMLSYYFAYPMILASLLLFAATANPKGRLLPEGQTKGRSVLGSAGKTALLAGAALGIAGWYFARNMALYNGDIFAMEASRICSETYAIPAMKPSVRATPQHMGVSVWFMLFDMGWIRTSAQSFFGVLGKMSVFLPGWTYAVFFGVLTAGCAFGMRIKKFFYAPVKWKAFAAALAAGLAGTVAMSVYYSYTQDFQPQGRYLLQAAVPVMCLFCFGTDRIAKNINARIKHPVQVYLIGMMALFHAVAFAVLGGAG